MVLVSRWPKPTCTSASCSVFTPSPLSCSFTVGWLCAGKLQAGAGRQAGARGARADPPAAGAAPRGARRTRRPPAKREPRRARPSVERRAGPSYPTERTASMTLWRRRDRAGRTTRGRGVAWLAARLSCPDYAPADIQLLEIRRRRPSTERPGPGAREGGGTHLAPA